VTLSDVLVIYAHAIHHKKITTKHREMSADRSYIFCTLIYFRHVISGRNRHLLETLFAGCCGNGKLAISIDARVPEMRGDLHELHVFAMCSARGLLLRVLARNQRERERERAKARHRKLEFSEPESSILLINRQIRSTDFANYSSQVVKNR